MTLWLTDTGHHVTGVALSQVQIQRAMRLVPGAQLISADVTAVAFEARSFDAIICLYTIIHLPLVEQASLLIRIASWLRPGGWLLLTAGDRSWTGSEQRWLDGRAPMWWSHADRSTYKRWLVEAGLWVIEEGELPEGDGLHSVFWAQRG